MIPYSQFKQSLGLSTISFQKSNKTNREFATVSIMSINGTRVNTSVSISPKVDKTKPLFVTYIEKYNDVEYNMYVICNASGVTEGSVL